MPNYDFQCHHCSKVFEQIATIKDMNKLINCECGGKAKRIISVGNMGFDFKGTGFYITDYKNKPAQQPTEKSKTPTTPTAAPSVSPKLYE